MAKKGGDKKKKGKAKRKYGRPTLTKHGSISGLSEKVIGITLAG